MSDLSAAELAADVQRILREQLPAGPLVLSGLLRILSDRLSLETPLDSLTAIGLLPRETLVRAQSEAKHLQPSDYTQKVAETLQESKD